jgi:hypothetical protein
MSGEPSEPLSPPRAPIAFRVGVVGHRPNRLPTEPASLKQIADLIGVVLAQVRDEVRAFAITHEGLYSGGEPQLLAVSPLAEGSDRLFAHAALDLGYRLCVPMPFLQADYEKDFGDPEGPPVDEFRDLLHRAIGTGLTRFELDGSREDEAAAYGAAGRVVVNQSDLLIVIWDGEPPRGGGGTVDTIQEALRYHVPVIWIDARAPFGWMVLHDMPENAEGRPPVADEAAMAEAVRAIVDDELALPEDHSQPSAHDGGSHKSPDELAEAYFSERRPATNWHFLWKSFRNLVSGKGPILPRLFTRDYLEDAKAENDGPDDENLLIHFGWADKLADLYADAHRSGVIATSGLSAFAVFLGLLPIMIGIEDGGHPKLLFALILFEFVIVVGLSRTISRARRKCYHEKWLEYRMLAEWIRQLRFMAPLGGGRPLLRARAHLSVYGEPTRSWMYWHVRAITRAYALPDTVADRTHIARCLDGIARTIDGQIDFHRVTMDRSERIQHRLHKGTKWLVRLTVAGVFLHLIRLLAEPLAGYFHLDLTRPSWLPERTGEIVGGLLLLCSAFLPAAGASIANINNQGEFARLGKRARAMRDSFLRLKPEADAMQRRLASEEPPVTMAQATSLAARMASTMLEEVVDWRVVVLDLPQGLE